MKEKLVQGIFHTYIGMVVATFGSSFFGLAINSNLLELSCNMSRTGIFRVLFALFLLTFMLTILQILSYQSHHTCSNPFRLLTLFAENHQTHVLNP